MSKFIKKRAGILASAPYTVAILIPALTLCLCNTATARDFFDPDFIKSVGQDSSSIPDLSVYATRDSQAPGEYRVDVVLNNELKETTSILFVEKQNGGLSPCLSVEKLSSYGLRLNAFPTLKNDVKGCANIAEIQNFTADLNFNTQQLLLSIPQAALSRHCSRICVA